MDDLLPAELPLAAHAGRGERCHPGGRSVDLTIGRVLAVLDGAPRDEGTLEMIVVRPAPGERRILEAGFVDAAEGLRGDNWSTRKATPNRLAQVTLINSAFALLVAGSRERAALTGDQLHVDLDLSVRNLPPGARLQIGQAVLEVTVKPHTGCGKFAGRFGAAAIASVRSEQGSAARLRGVNASVVQAGSIRLGDRVQVTDRFSAAGPA